jgi:hypothetical protein
LFFCQLGVHVVQQGAELFDDNGALQFQSAVKLVIAIIIILYNSNTYVGVRSSLSMENGSNIRDAF